MLTEIPKETAHLQRDTNNKKKRKDKKRIKNTIRRTQFSTNINRIKNKK